MKRLVAKSSLLAAIVVAIIIACSPQQRERLYPLMVRQITPEKAGELAEQIRKEVAVEVADGLELSLWASDSLVHDPIAISIDEKGRVFYTSATRQANSEFDVRGHRNWITASVSFQTPEDRRKFLRETFAEGSDESERHLKDLNGDGVKDWRDLTVEKEEVWFVEDASGNGLADRAQLYIKDFHEEITDVANGVEVHNGEVFIAVGPDLWRTRDVDGDGIADEKESISHGYAVHIGFSGHGMSGVKVGPQGRIWWGIGDIGMNVVDKEGKRWKYPNRGVVVRSEPDGTNFEVFAAGVRNTHEFVFDEYGNLISEDNDGDHRGERERLVYLIDGSDTGWRTNWQYGKYTDPDNNTYKVWMDERMSVPRWEGQAAYFLPPITNYVNGPTGMVYNPGTALGEQWYKHFFIAEFRGNPANSPVHAFTLKPKGATFELDQTQEVVSGVLPTGLDFGPDGALYFADWIDGWGTKDEGRIWKLDVPGGATSAIRQETKKHIEADFSKYNLEQVAGLLKHQDMRVRQKAQFELVDRGEKGLEQLKAAAAQTEHQLARVHGLWGISQFARKDNALGSLFVPYLADADPEIIAQAARLIGDIRYKEAGAQLIGLLQNESPRVQFFAMEALGRTAHEPAIQPIVKLLEANNDEDTWLRHGGAIALERIGKADALKSLSTHESRAVRIAAVVALRRMQAPEAAVFLKDADEYIVTEAARAINDDWSIEGALPDLANALAGTEITNEAFVRRAINANLRTGKAENMQILADYAKRTDAPAAMRAEAIAALSTWAKPSVFDRVDGRYRGVIERDPAPVQAILQPILMDLLKENAVDVKLAAARAAAKLGMEEAGDALFALLRTAPSSDVRVTALQSLSQLGKDQIGPALELALADKDPQVRSTALELIPESDLPLDQSVNLFKKVLKEGGVQEKQAALAALSNYEGKVAAEALATPLADLISGKIENTLQLDVIEAVEKQKDPELLAQLQTYQDAKPKDDPIALFREALYGGSPRAGWFIFNRHEAAQCTRCHAVFEFGGNAGPGLAGVGDRLTKEQILESLVAPSAAYAPGFGVVTLELKDGGETVAGVLMEESETALQLRVGKDDLRTIEKSSIAKRENVPSSMPNMSEILTKREIRDLVAYLSRLKGEEM